MVMQAWKDRISRVKLCEFMMVTCIFLGMIVLEDEIKG